MYVNVKKFPDSETIFSDFFLPDRFIPDVLSLSVRWLLSYDSNNWSLFLFQLGEILKYEYLLLFFFSSRWSNVIKNELIPAYFMNYSSSLSISIQYLKARFLWTSTSERDCIEIKSSFYFLFLQVTWKITTCNYSGELEIIPHHCRRESPRMHL